MVDAAADGRRSERLRSGLCKQEQLESEAFRGWVAATTEPFRLHRKCWEFAFICQALHERGMLAPGRRGLGFGVGTEPLAAIFAARGCQVVATDLDEDRARQAGWVETHQHAATLEALNRYRICDPAAFGRRVSFRTVDMNAIPSDLRGFDFTWSSCSLEHLGSIAQGLHFLERQLDCLRPGGIAVHTTEFNLTSDDRTIDNNRFVVLFRRRDLEGLALRLTARGHEIALDLTPGDRVADNFVDLPPYPGSSWEDRGQQPYHLRLLWDQFETTSVGLIIRKSAGRSAPGVLRRAATWLSGRAAGTRASDAA